MRLSVYLLFHTHPCLYELNALCIPMLLSIHVYACYVGIYLLFMDDAWKNEKTPICAKIGIVMHLLIFKIQCTNSGGVFYFDELSSFYFKSETLFLLS
jgi:hypothetical protein